MNYMDIYNEWLNSDVIDKDTKEILLTLTEEEKEDSFYKDLEFGTAGLRGLMGPGTNRMNKYTIAKITEGLANHILNKNFTNPSVVIAYDSRHNSDLFASITALVLNKKGIKTYIFKKLTSTPELAYAALQLKTSMAINITSSHNPKEYNGYKIYNSEGFQVVDPEDKEILSEINKVKEYKNINIEEIELMINAGLFNYVDDAIVENFALETRKLAIKDNSDKKTTVIYTPLHGTGAVPMTNILTKAGYINLHLVAEQKDPDPNFSTAAYPNPEDKTVFALAINLAKKHNADIIIASDPDADRMGVVVKDSTGEYVNLSGNQVGILIGAYILENRSNLENGLMIKTIVTSNMLEPIAKRYGVNVENVYTGTKFIGEKIAEYVNDSNKKYIFGFEESIGYMVGDYVRDKNSFSAALIMCELCEHLKEKGMTILENLEELYKTYGYYAEDTLNDYYPGIEGVEKIKSIMAKFRDSKLENIIGLKVIVKEDYLSQKRFNYNTNEESIINLPPSNVLKYIFEDNSWFAVRPSGTEPKIKYYLQTVGETEEASKEKLSKITEYLTANFR